jgi:sterol desaturase/sphingolipid hydroxylase (fatty acid hydroxylase superfamily)
MTSFSDLSSSVESDVVMEAVWEISKLVLIILALTVVLELFSLDTVRAILKQPDGPELYRKAWALNVINPLFVGIPLYPIAAIFFCTQKPVESLTERVVQVTWVAASHGVQYYFIHKAFHENPKLYKRFHSFHHRFNTHTPPSSGNAVTMAEFFVAYVAPIVVSCMMFPVHPSSLIAATYILQVTHLFVHTPRLEDLSERWVPGFLVSTKNHQDHHRKLNKHYASPTINVDNILAWFTPLDKEKDT